MSLSRLLGFIATAFVVTVIPGRACSSRLGRALASGRRVAVLSVLGNAAGECVQVITIAFGIGAAGRAVSRSVCRAPNSKTVVFLAAILPTGDVAGQILLVGLLFAVIAVFSDTGWALAAGSLRSWFARFPQRLGLVGAVGGLGIAAVGLGVLVTGRKD